MRANTTVIERQPVTGGVEGVPGGVETTSI